MVSHSPFVGLIDIHIFFLLLSTSLQGSFGDTNRPTVRGDIRGHCDQLAGVLVPYGRTIWVFWRGIRIFLAQCRLGLVLWLVIWISSSRPIRHSDWCIAAKCWFFSQAWRGGQVWDRGGKKDVGGVYEGYCGWVSNYEMKQYDHHLR